jgi:outer membrane protein assembly factor BamB
MSFHAQTGEVLWAAGDSSAGYGSPFPATLSGQSQVLILNHQSLASHDPRTGRVNWEVPFGTGFPLVANPIRVADDSIVVTAGYNVGAERFRVGTGTNTPVSLWTSKKLKAKFSNPVAKNGFIYGLDDGILACLDVQNGSQRWKEGRYGHGQGLLAGDLLVLMSETGELILLNPTPEAPHELGRFSVFHSKTWNPIALSGNCLLVRNDQEAAALILPIAGD